MHEDDELSSENYNRVMGVPDEYEDEPVNDKNVPVPYSFATDICAKHSGDHDTSRAAHEPLVHRAPIDPRYRWRAFPRQSFEVLPTTHPRTVLPTRPNPSCSGKRTA